MPRRRHDTSPSDSDSSDDSARRSPVAQPTRSPDRKSRKSPNRNRDKKKQVEPARERRRKSSSSDSDNERSSTRQSKAKQNVSESDESPVKRSVASRVEKSSVAAGRKRRESNSPEVKASEKRGDRGSGQKTNRQNVSPSPKQGGKKADRRNRSMSPIRRQNRDSQSPRRQRQDNRTQSRNESSQRSVSNERNVSRSGGRNERRGGARSPDRNRGDQGRRRSRSPAARDRSDFDQRRDTDRDNVNRNRPTRGRSHSPVNQKGGRSDRGNDNQTSRRSRSPDTRKQRSLSRSPIRGKERQPSPSSSQSKSKGKRSVNGDKDRERKKGENPATERRNDSQDDEVDRKSNSSRKSKGSKKSKEGTEKDDGLESSFERSKKYLVSHSDDFDIPEPEETEILSPPSSKTSSRSKRQRDTSESGSESPKKAKKHKETARNQADESPAGKKSKKKLKKDDQEGERSRSGSVEQSASLHKPSKGGAVKKGAGKRSQSRSPRPPGAAGERSERGDLDRSRSRGASFGRNHDMAQFESEPESGEITDSEEEGKQAVKSLVNKPRENEDPMNLEDERLLRARRKAEQMKIQVEKEKKEAAKKQSKEIAAKEPEKSSKRKPEAPAKVLDSSNDVVAPAAKRAKPVDSGVAALTGKTGGAYIPPARLRAMQAKITDKSSVEFQRISWEALKKSINGLVNKVNVANIENIVRELFQENIVRGRGLMARSIIQAQAASPTFTHVYAALVAIVNTKFPQNGELILRRLVVQFRRGYKRNNKELCLSSTKFVAHLVNQQVAHEVLALEILTLLLETPTDDSVEVCIGFLKECGQKLTEVTPRGINAIFERLRNVLHESKVELRVQYMMEVMFAVRKDQFKDFPAIVDELDLVMEEDQFTHLLPLEDAIHPEDILNVFKPDPNFQENEEKYSILKKEILGEGNSDDEEAGSGSDSGSDEEEDSDNEEAEEAKQKIIDQTETNMVALKRTIYLTIQSSLDFEECAHKLLKMDLKPGQENELCYMILDCCAQMRTYEKFFGLLAGRFCMIDRKYVMPFQNMFAEQYETIHRLETQKLRNVAKFFAHLLFTDSISWAVLLSIKLNEDDTTSASRIFIKILFQELSEFLGLPKLNERLKDPTLQEYYVGLLPRDNPRDTRFAINFFTTIGLGGLTDDLRDHLKNVSKKLMQQKQEQEAAAANAPNSSDDSSEASSDDSSSESSESASDSSSDSDSSGYGKKKKKKDKKKKEKKKQKQAKQKKKASKEVIPEKSKAKGSSRKDKTNGSLNQKVVREDRDKDANKKGKKKKNVKTDKDIQKEHEEKFRKLAALANYGNIEEMGAARGGTTAAWGDRDSGGRERAGRGKKGAARRMSNDREDYNGSSDEQRMEGFRDGGHARGRGEMMESQSRRSGDFDRSYERQSSFDSRDGRGSGWGSGRDLRGSGREDPGSGFDDLGRGGGQDYRAGAPPQDQGGVIYRDERRGAAAGGGVRGAEKGQGRSRKNRKNKKGRGDVSLEDSREDENVRVERTFERMDLYEEKFDKERERNVETMRYRDEFQDFYRGRDEGGRDGGAGAFARNRDDRDAREPPRGGGDDRDMYKGRSRGGGGGDMDDRYDRAPPPAPPIDEGRRRGRNRSVEPAVIRRDDRRKRR